MSRRQLSLFTSTPATGQRAAPPARPETLSSPLPRSRRNKTPPKDKTTHTVAVVGMLAVRVQGAQALLSQHRTSEVVCTQLFRQHHKAARDGWAVLYCWLNLALNCCPIARGGGLLSNAATKVCSGREKSTSRTIDHGGAFYILHFTCVPPGRACRGRRCYRWCTPSTSRGRGTCLRTTTPSGSPWLRQRPPGRRRARPSHHR